MVNREKLLHSCCVTRGHPAEQWSINALPPVNLRRADSLAHCMETVAQFIDLIADIVYLRRQPLNLPLGAVGLFHRYGETLRESNIGFATFKSKCNDRVVGESSLLRPLFELLLRRIQEWLVFQQTIERVDTTRYQLLLSQKTREVFFHQLSTGLCSERVDEHLLLDSAPLRGITRIQKPSIVSNGVEGRVGYPAIESCWVRTLHQPTESQ